MRKIVPKPNKVFLILLHLLLLTGIINAQELKVSGKVTDENQQPIPGANVSVKGTTTGTVTNLDGIYSIVIPDPQAELVFSFVGYLTENVRVEGKNEVNAMLVPDIMELQQVVVVGYGNFKKSDLTGAVVSVSAEEIKNNPVTGFDQALQGRAAGVTVTQNSGAPGGAVSVRIRGIGSATGNNEPLYVIDGIPITNDVGGSQATPFGGQKSSPLNMINPNDIESMEILKDASAAAIYGSRASNGVILITTKRGKSGKPKVSFETYYGVQQIQRSYPILSAQEWTKKQNQIIKDTYYDTNNVIHQIWRELLLDPRYEDWKNLGDGTSTNWVDKLFRKAPMANYQLSVEGGNDRSTYSMSVNSFNQEGIMLNSDFKRHSFRVNTDHNYNKLKFGNNLLLTSSTENQAVTDAENDSWLRRALQACPIAPIYDSLGQYIGPPASLGGGRNIVAVANETVNKVNRLRVLGGLYGEYEFFKGFSFRSDFSVDYMQVDQTAFQPTVNRGTEIIPQNTLTRFNSLSGSWFSRNYFTYVKTLFEKHSINIMAGFDAQASNYTSINNTAQEFSSNEYYTLSIANIALPPSERISEHRLASYYGRAFYNFDDRYLFTATLRRDGSSRFGSGKKWGYFPAFAFGWRVSEEDFMKNIPAVSNLKLRVGYGETGGQEIPNYRYLALVNNVQYTLGGQIVAGAAPVSLSLPDLQWETSIQKNIGVDLGMFKNRISITADLFQRINANMLLPANISLDMGIENTPYANLGEVQNKGVEFALTTHNIDRKDFSWFTDFTFSAIRNEVTDLAGQTITSGPSRTEKGHPIGSFYGFIVKGIFQDQSTIDSLNALNPEKPYQPGAQPGDLWFADLNGDGTITTNDDRTFIGNPHPDFEYSISSTMKYKGIGLTIFVYGTHGGDVYNTLRQRYVKYSGYSNRFKEVLSSWQDTDPNRPGYHSTWNPRGVLDDPNDNLRGSTRWVEDGSFVKIKNVRLSYDLPSSLLSKLKLNTCQVYMSGSNLYTITKYKGLDPEIGALNQNSLTTGIDYGNYPLPKQYLIGLNISF